MEDNTNLGSGAPSGGAGGTPSGDSSAPKSGETKAVSWENHQRALEDLHKFKKKVGELEMKLGDIESASLREKKDFETLYEQEKAKRAEAEAAAKKTLSWAQNTQRFNAVKQEAIALGLKKEAYGDLDLLDLDDVKVETTDSGRFIVHGAKERAERLKNERGYWFQTTTPPSVNAGGGGAPPAPTGNKRLSKEDILKADEDLKRKKITPKEYNDLFMRYCKETQLGVVPAAPPPNNP